MTKVSIIVPFHNVENYISKCLSSLIHQTLNDIEIICIDDASTDSSRQIVLEYAQNDNRIILLQTDTISGQSHCRNLGLEVATGEYIGFVDSDDWVEIDMFNKLYQHAQYNNTDITMCKATLFDDKTQEVYSDDYYNLKSLEKFGNNTFSSYDSKNEILDVNVVLWNKIYKKEFLSRTNAKFADGFIYEDLLFFFETYIQANRINIVWENLYYYRQNRSFSTMQNSDKKVYDRIPMVERTYNVLKQAPFFQEKKIDIICWIIDDIFHRYTLLEDKYYHDYYDEMKGFFSRIELNEEDKEKLAVSYCYDEFCNILERSYYGFWQFLIEKYKTSNKRIKAAEHKCNLDIKAIKDYAEECKTQAQQDKQEVITWWKNHCSKEKESTIAELEQTRQRDLKLQLEEFEEKKQIEFKAMYEKQDYINKQWTKQELDKQKEELTNKFKWELQQQATQYEKAIIDQQVYYENHYLLVRLALKYCRTKDLLVNKFKKILKKN